MHDGKDQIEIIEIVIKIILLSSVCGYQRVWVMSTQYPKGLHVIKHTFKYLQPSAIQFNAYTAPHS